MVPAPAPETVDLSNPPRPGEYLWTYLGRNGMPKGVIMERLHDAIDAYEKQTGRHVIVHGSGRHEWFAIRELNYSSDTPTLLHELGPFIKT